MGCYKYDDSLDSLSNFTKRNLNNLELDAINILLEFIAKYLPDLSKYYKNYNYITGKATGALGYYGKGHLFLDIAIFAMPFSHALALLLHEMLHFFGTDGSKEFTYALTDVIQKLLDDGDIMQYKKIYESKWEIMKNKIINRHNTNENNRKIAELSRILLKKNP
jgi:hypothetical protein